jgi:hypothetical protein
MYSNIRVMIGCPLNLMQVSANEAAWESLKLIQQDQAAAISGKGGKDWGLITTRYMDSFIGVFLGEEVVGNGIRVESLRTKATLEERAQAESLIAALPDVLRQSAALGEFDVYFVEQTSKGTV